MYGKFVEVDSGDVEVDSGDVEVDSGDVEVDRGGLEVDVQEVDRGGVEVDSGGYEMDVEEVDSGGVEVDRGGIEVDRVGQPYLTCSFVWALSLSHVIIEERTALILATGTYGYAIPMSSLAKDADNDAEDVSDSNSQDGFEVLEETSDPEIKVVKQVIQGKKSASRNGTKTKGDKKTSSSRNSKTKDGEESTKKEINPNELSVAELVRIIGGGSENLEQVKSTIMDHIDNGTTRSVESANNTQLPQVEVEIGEVETYIRFMKEVVDEENPYPTLPN
ncbi:unnamed protein product [Orchesella dallaii]|uniref:Uncharacterized protein n=1 Tax=Orchesella dallaii TaxID=48710 RepID=A0ABP1R450_9HEXA